MKLLLTCAGGGEEGWCQYALVSLSDEMKKSTLARRALLQMVKSRDPETLELVFQDTFAIFYDHFDKHQTDGDDPRSDDELCADARHAPENPCRKDCPACLEECGQSVLTDEQWEELDAVGHLIVSDEFEPTAEPARTECDRLIIDEDGFYWRAGVKHTDVNVETALLSYDLLLTESG